MGKSKTLILIDGHALAFREFYALERTQMRTNAGTPTWAVYGFFKAIFDLLKNKDINADSIGVAFDVSHHTFRTEKYVEYKANREAMPDDMQAQMNFIYEGLNAFNIPIYTKAGFEADDVIGTISQKACDLGHKTLILTGDQDSFQLIDKKGCVKVIIPTKGELKEYGWDEVYAKLGVYPDQVIDYKALRGDTSDNIPGIKGIGEKTAVKLLAQFQTVDNVLAHADEISGNAVREKIKNGVESAKLSKYLATIVRDVDIDFDMPKSLGLASITKTFEQEIAVSETKFHRGSLRSGQKMEVEGSIVVIGDVNSGAEIIASDNIVVLGTLRGLAHAGAKGNKQAVIAAGVFDAVQVRIANIVKEINRDDEPLHKNSYLYVENDKIIIE